MLQMVRHRTATAWAVTHRETGEYLGECHLAKIVDNHLGDLGYLFRREYWGQGYASEAVAAVIDYSTRELKLHRLCAQIDDRNDRSKTLITRAGFTWIATLPEADFGGRVADVAYYARSLAG
jgi:ribosomal-protein-alanine N-acetyltransferase